MWVTTNLRSSALLSRYWPFDLAYTLNSLSLGWGKGALFILPRTRSAQGAWSLVQPPALPTRSHSPNLTKVTPCLACHLEISPMQ